MLHDAIVASGYGSGGFFFRFNSIMPKLSRGNLKSGAAYVTHDYPPDNLPTNVKVIYMFSDPRDVAISVCRQINVWGGAHHSHLSRYARFRPNEQVLMEDSLGLYDHFVTWMAEHKFPFASVRYDALGSQSVREQLAMWLGFMPVFPEWRQRPSIWSEHPKSEDIDSSYKKLTELVCAADDFRVWPARIAC
jgi:hypothetical protein